MPFRFHFSLRRNPFSTQPVPEEEPVPFSSGEIFLANLPEVDPKSLPAEDRTCVICQDKYGERPASEHPVKLPCGHHMGASCVKNWFSPDGSNKNTCPLCREILFELEDEEEEDGEVDEDEQSSRTFMDLLAGEDPDFDAAFDAVLPLLQEFQNVQENNLLSMTGEAPRPADEEDFFHTPADRPILISALVGSLFEVFSRNTAATSREDMVMIKIMLGRLAECFATAKIDLLWDVRGPDMEHLRDPESLETITGALQQLLRFEGVWYQNHLRAIERRQSRSRRRGWSLLGL